MIASRQNEPTEAQLIEANYRTRPIELSKLILGALPQTYILNKEEIITKSTLPTPVNINSSDDVNLLLQEAATASNFIGLILAWGLTHLIALFVKFPTRSSLSKEGENIAAEDLVPLDPLYRAVKTLASFGQMIGMTLGLLIPTQFGRKIASNLFGTALGFGFGILGIGFYFIKKPFVRYGFSFEWSSWRFGPDGWTKYAKTALVLGSVLGSTIFGIVFLANGGGLANITTPLAIGGGIVGGSFFVLSIIFTPLISNYTKNINKFCYRSNYTRAGITVGSALGAIIGFAVAFYLGWSLSFALAALSLASAIGATVGGPVFSFGGRYITDKFQPIDPATGIYKDTDNSWDYSLRNVGAVFGSLGTFIGCFVGNTSAAGNVLPVAVGFAWPAFLGACGTLVGCGIGLLVVHVARKLCPNEERTVLPYTQRMIVGYAWGTGICAAIGLGIGLCLGATPIALTIWALKGSSLGGFIGGGIASFTESASRKVWKLLFKSITDGISHLFYRPRPPQEPLPQNSLNPSTQNEDNRPASSPAPTINILNLEPLKSKYDNSPPSMSTNDINTILQKNISLIEVVEEATSTPKESSIIPGTIKNMNHSCMFSSKLVERTITAAISSPAPAA